MNIQQKESALLQHRKGVFETMREFKDYKFAVIRGKTAFFVRSVGHFRVLPGNREGLKTADFGEIFWCLEGKGLFSLNGRRHSLLPGQVWYYPPGARHDYIPGDPLFHYRWLSLEGNKDTFRRAPHSPRPQCGGGVPRGAFCANRTGNRIRRQRRADASPCGGV